MHHVAHRIERKHMLILFVVIFIALIDGIDGSIVNIVLPTLATYMGTDTGTISWVTVTYFMMIAGTILLFGRIANNGAIKNSNSSVQVITLCGPIYTPCPRPYGDAQALPEPYIRWLRTSSCAPSSHREAMSPCLRRSNSYS